MLKSLGVWLVLSLAVSGGVAQAHESHGDGSLGGYGFLRLLSDVVSDLNTAPNLPWHPMTDALVSIDITNCTTVPVGGRSLALVVHLIDDVRCRVHVNESEWVRLNDYESRWKNTCRGMLRHEDERRIHDVCEQVYRGAHRNASATRNG